MIVVTQFTAYIDCYDLALNTCTGITMVTTVSNHSILSLGSILSKNDSDCARFLSQILTLTEVTVLNLNDFPTTSTSHRYCPPLAYCSPSCFTVSSLLTAYTVDLFTEMFIYTVIAQTIILLQVPHRLFFHNAPTSNHLYIHLFHTVHTVTTTAFRKHCDIVY